MGDLRADIKIEIDFIGIKKKQEFWINYCGDYLSAECYGVDNRIVEFFRDIYEKGIEKYDRILQEQYEKEHKKEIEENEKKELKRLQNKYQENPTL